ncbi:MAG: NPCBM/NEW2 domain-containing protein, partial [Planctomycetes bacterium]|nr:NPCBM/NEW2 domain-containing protein [Planctomycetota bacterium]
MLAVVSILLGLVAPARSSASEPLVNQLKRGGEPAEHAKVSVVGFSQLTLRAEGVPDYHFAHSDWGDARLIDADGRVTYLSDLKPLRVHQPYGKLQRDRSHRGGPITIGGRRFERGLGTHASSEITYSLAGKYAWFEVWFGVDATAGTNGQVRFTITERPATRAGDVDPAALRRAITDLIETFGPRYPRGPEFLARLDAWERGDAPLAQLRREALLANPLLDFDRLLLVRRRPKGGNADRA